MDCHDTCSETSSVSSRSKNGTVSTSHDTDLFFNYIVFIDNMAPELRNHKANKFISEIFSPFGRYHWEASKDETNVKVTIRNLPSKKDFLCSIEKDEVYLPKSKNFTIFSDIKSLFVTRPCDLEEFSKQISSEKSIFDQLRIIQEEVFLNESDIDTRRRCTEYLECVLKFYGFPCQLFCTGSTRTYIGLRNADLDIFVDLQQLVPPVPKSQAMDVLKSIQKALRRALRVFVPKPISARCPIIKIDFRKGKSYPNGISIDLCVSNNIATYNSLILKTYLDNLPYFVELACLIKYWFAYIGFIGPNSITSYMCMNMVLFFLQCHKLAPSVQDLQRDAEKDYVEGQRYNVGFTTTPFLKYHSLQLQISQLLLMFFNFYAKFPYALRIISAYTGNALPVEIFYSKYNSEKTSLTMQDMLQPDMNKGINMLNQFFFEFRHTFIAINQFITSKETQVENDELATELYSKLLTSFRSSKEIEKYSKSRKIAQSYRMTNLILESMDYEILLKTIEKWAWKSLDLVESLLKDVLKFSTVRCDSVQPGTNVSRQCKLGQFTINLTDNDHHVWLERNATTRWASHSSASDFINYESQVTKDLRNNCNNSDMKHFGQLSLTFSLIINASAYSQLSEIHFDFKQHVGSNLSVKTIHSLETFISNYTLYYLSLEFAAEYPHLVKAHK